MPYLVHPDKVLAINDLIKRHRAGERNLEKKRIQEEKMKRTLPQTTGSPLLDKLAQQLFLKRQAKQKGIL